MRLRFPVASLVFSAEGAKHTSPGQAALKARAALGERPSEIARCKRAT